MSFLSNGDFIFPLKATLHWFEHLFVWSFQTGAPNLDGIIRLPVRLLNLLVFQFFGNLGHGYFYLALALVVMVISFYVFARSFLKIGNRYICILGALLFTFNPIFLGNLAKVGLVIAVALLPLMLVVLKKTFQTKQLRYLLLYILLLNVSLVHPYTFTVNLIISGIYLAFLSWQQRRWLLLVWPKILGVIGVGVLLNAYFILSIVSVGSIDKSILSQDLDDSPIDYTALIGIANTGDMLTALALIKNIFLDFNFFNAAYQPFYFLGAFMLMGLVIGVYLLAQKHLPRIQHWRVLACWGAILILLLLSTGTLFNIDKMIRFLIELPGGWMFRSPLKWQLYLPFFLVSVLLICVKYLPKKWMLNTATGVVVVAIILINGFLIYDISKKLLVPRQIGEFAQLQATDLENKTVLFVNSEACLLYAQEKPATFTELNQVITSKNVQMKRVSEERLESVNVDSYDYIIGCVGSADKLLTEDEHIKPISSFDQNGIELYQNSDSRPFFYALNEVYALSESRDIQKERQFINNNFGRPMDFVDIGEGMPSSGLYELFAGLNIKNVKDNQLSSVVVPNNGGNQIISLPDQHKLYYKREGSNKIILTPDSQPGYQKIPTQATELKVEAPAGQNLDFRYQDKAYSFENLLPNNSFEMGLWRDRVSDCNNFDSKANIAQSHDKSQSTDGYRSLQLTATRHIACTTPPDKISVEPGADYLLSFDYKSSGDKRAGYFIGFDDPKKTTIVKRLAYPDSGWHTASVVVQVPPDATNLELLVYAFPDYASSQEGVAYYDNFFLTKVPKIDSQFFMRSVAKSIQSPEPKIDYQPVNPTFYNVNVIGAKQPFYLAMKDTYHPKWNLATKNNWLDSAATDHFVINGSMNGWYIDPAQLCQQNQSCQSKPDGTYDIQLQAEFTPQRATWIGVVVSGLTALAVIGFFIFTPRQSERGLKWKR